MRAAGVRQRGSSSAKHVLSGLLRSLWSTAAHVDHTARSINQSLSCI